LPTSSPNEKSFYIGHKKECKKKSQNNNINNNQINDNSINNNINIINPPINSINNINNSSQNQNNNINNIPPPPNNNNLIIPPPNIIIGNPPTNNNNVIRPIPPPNINIIPPPNKNVIPPPNIIVNGPIPNIRPNPPNVIIQPPPYRPISHNIITQKNKKCPNCKVLYRYDTQYYINLYNQHVKRCRPSQYNYNNYSTYSNNNLPNYSNPIRVNANNQELNNILEAIGLETKKVLPRGKKDGTFEEKVDYLRFDISKKKIDFINGAEKLNINREKVFEDSMEQFEKINPFKELKIIFIGEESHDAGGLIREWLTILFKTILDHKTGLFERSDTEEIGYVIKPDLSPSQEKLKQYFFIGRVLAKALLENLTVNCCFNKVIYQLILGEKIKLDDLIFIDRPLYKSLKQLITMKEECGGENIAFCEIYFTYDLEGKDGTVYQQDLIENGREILVTQDNLDLYIDKRIEYYTKSQMGGIKEIISGINTIFPVEYLKIFTSDQLGLLINGTPFIDTEDWRMNTQYKNYKDYDNVIINFWDIISNLSQEELSNFLLFCTGSSRVPIGGFKSLESNRGQIAKFEIVKTEYIAGKKNFLRAHTCFNRLDLPNFPDKNTLDEAVKFALENEVLGFGIE
jgi:E3 ubiquitin-protein ligase HUWE1